MPFLDTSRAYFLPYAASQSRVTWLIRMTEPRSTRIQASSAKLLDQRVAPSPSAAAPGPVAPFSLPDAVTEPGSAVWAAAARSVSQAAACAAGRGAWSAKAMGAARASRAAAVVAARVVREGTVGLPFVSMGLRGRARGRGYALRVRWMVSRYHLALSLSVRSCVS